MDDYSDDFEEVFEQPFFHCYLQSMFKGHFHNVYSLCFSSDQTKLCSVGADKKIRLWNLNENIDSVQISEYSIHQRFISSCEFSPSGDFVVTGSGDKTVGFLSLCSDFSMILRGHTDYVRSTTFNDDGKKILSSARDGRIKVWDIETQRCEQTLEKSHCGRSVNSVLFLNGTENQIVSGGEDYRVNIWDLRLKNNICIESLMDHLGIVNSVCCHQDSNTIASSGSDGSVKLYDIRTFNLLHDFQVHESSVLEIDFHPSGNYLVSGTAYHNCCIRIFDLMRKKVIFTSKVDHSDDVNTIKFAPDGKSFASGSDDERILLWKTNLYCSNQWKSVMDLKERMQYILKNIKIILDLKKFRSQMVLISYGYIGRKKRVRLTKSLLIQ